MKGWRCSKGHYNPSEWYNCWICWESKLIHKGNGVDKE